MGKKEGMKTSALEKKACHDIWVADKKDQKPLNGKIVQSFACLLVPVPFVSLTPCLCPLLKYTQALFQAKLLVEDRLLAP